VTDFFGISDASLDQMTTLESLIQGSASSPTFVDIGDEDDCALYFTFRNDRGAQGGSPCPSEPDGCGDYGIDKPSLDESGRQFNDWRPLYHLAIGHLLAA